MKYLVAMLLISSLASCAANAPKVEAKPARLYVERPDSVMIDNVRFTRKAIWLSPGKHFIGQNCPTQPNSTLSAVDSPAPIEYTFEAGAEYVLLCNGSGVVIAPLER